MTTSEPINNETRRGLMLALVAGLQGTKIEAAVCADQDGQMLAHSAADPSQMSTTIEALSTFASRIAQTSGVLADTSDHESHFFDWDGRQVIGKRFEYANRVWLLVVLCPAKTAYKQAMSKLIRHLETAITPIPLEFPVKAKRVARKSKKNDAGATD